MKKWRLPSDNSAVWNGGFVFAKPWYVDSIAVGQGTVVGAEGETVCASKLRRPVSLANEKVIEWVEANITQELALRLICELRDEWQAEAKDARSQTALLKKEAEKLRRETDRLVNAWLGRTTGPTLS